MHDPMTVAFEIRSPFRDAPSKLWPKGYRHSLVTIWHVDPERDAHKRGLRGDNSCGWFTPPTTPEERARFHKIGEQEYSCLFGKRHATAEGKDYVRVCYEPEPYDAIYWAWRRIKYEGRPRYVWKFGRARRAMSPGELEEIYSLASNPVDNLRVTVAGVHDAESCGDFFLTVYRCYKRFNRPWYKHPRWHFWHWRFQVHHWQALRRWFFSRCAGCGKRFPYGYSPVSFQRHEPRPKLFCGETGVYHSECANTSIPRAAEIATHA